MCKSIENVKEEFICIKENILELIKEKEEITPKTKCKKSAIYMIYIDDWTDDKIIPIYIGKSVDVQHRYKNHYCEILSLNRLTYDEYKDYNDSGIYDGTFKSCKIFKYMIEHNCTLADYHLVVLEYCDTKLLDDREQYYINKFKSEYFGFNQLNLTTLFPVYIRNNVNDLKLYDAYIDAFKKNCELIPKYYLWGFTKFNYEYSFPTGTLTTPANLPLSDKFKAKIKELDIFINQLNTLLDSPIYHIKMKNLKETKDINKFLANRKIIFKEIRQSLLPNFKYDKYPLKCNLILEELSNNTIRFVLSNNGNNKIADIIMIDYKINNNYEFKFISNETNINSNNIEYGEKDIYYRNSMSFRRNFFNVIPKNFIYYYSKPRIKDETKTSRFISVLSEFKTGINDISIIDKDLECLDIIITNIVDKMFNLDKVNIICTESKSVLKDILNRELSKKTKNYIRKKTTIFDI